MDPTTRIELTRVVSGVLVQLAQLALGAYLVHVTGPLILRWLDTRNELLFKFQRRTELERQIDQVRSSTVPTQTAILKTEASLD